MAVSIKEQEDDARATAKALRTRTRNVGLDDRHRRHAQVEEARATDTMEADQHRHPNTPGFRSAYRTILGGDGPQCRPGQTFRAKDYLRKIERAQEQGGWTGAERTRLAKMHKKWSARAAGKDARFQLFGNRPGRVSRADERRMREYQHILDGPNATAAIAAIVDRAKRD